MLTRTCTRPVTKISTRPDPTGPAGIPIARTRSLPVGLPLLVIIGLVAYPLPPPGAGPLHCISSDESIFCCGEHVLHASSFITGL